MPDLSCAAFYLRSVAISKWAMLGSNQRPPPCKGRVILFSGLRRIVNCLQMSVFSGGHFSGVFSVFAQVAALGLLPEGSGGPQKPFSWLSEGIRRVFTISTEAGEKTCVPTFTSLRSDHHVLVVADAGNHSSTVSARNGCRNA